MRTAAASVAEEPVAEDGRRITTKEAVVRTASVEIKTLTVSGKQLTLAVFRQLQSEPLIDDETGSLRGIPWGRVNYHADGCASEPPHLHVVWQRTDELRRASVPARWPLEAMAKQSLADARKAADGQRTEAIERTKAVLAGWLAQRGLRDGPGICPWPSQPAGNRESTYTISTGEWVFTLLEREPPYPLEEWWHWPRGEYRPKTYGPGGPVDTPETEAEQTTRRQEQVASLATSLKTLLDQARDIEHKWSDAPPVDDLVDLLNRSVAAEKLVWHIDAQPAVQALADTLRQGCEGYAKTFDQLLAIQHLFIAV